MKTVWAIVIGAAVIALGTVAGQLLLARIRPTMSAERNGGA